MGIECVYCQDKDGSSDCRTDQVVCFGHFIRKSDGACLKRYRCKDCSRTFSEATLSRCHGQKKRHLNPPLFQLLCSGVSQRRASRILKINRKTVVRKFLLLGAHAKELLAATNRLFPKATEIQFDDLETFEHSKCKPLSVTMAVEEGTRRILGFQVAQMPAKGLLAAVSRKKYGPRKDHRPQARKALFEELQDLMEEGAVIKSDQNPHYVPDVAKYFPKSQHRTYKGRRGCVVGQGELKAGGYDPLFSLNHSFAMARANINRLVRRTWCTTKLRQRLDLHFAMYALYHNLVLINSPSR